MDRLLRVQGSSTRDSQYGKDSKEKKYGPHSPSQWREEGLAGRVGGGGSSSFSSLERDGFTA